MRSWINRSCRAALTAGLTIGLAAPAMAATVYSWVTDEGTHAFTDNPKRIPAKYKDAAERRTLGKLNRYERWTPSDPVGKGEYGDRLPGHLERLREANAAAETAARRTAAAGGNAPALRLAEDINIPLADGGGPIEVETKRVKPKSWTDGVATRSVTVVRQDGEIIAVVKPESNDRDVYQEYEEDFTGGL